MKDLIITAVIGLSGALLLFSGYRLARIVIAIWGFVAGFALGASAASDALSNAFAGSSTGLVAGLILGSIFALFAYFFFELAIVLLFANIGYWVGTSFIGLLGIQKGFLPSVIGIMLGVFFGLITLFINAPKIILVLITSIGGALAVVSTLLIFLDKIALDNLSYAATAQQVNSSWVWYILTLGIFIIGVIIQLASSQGYHLKQWRALDEPAKK